ncbi:MAG: restriction endonuclease subunit S, partial [Algibacter sp.]|uniref:restriction endonuclease subunit S n=1 Tax=Algibacter sp. TaxID=1872428 RepID=UPI0026329DE6
KRIKLLEEQAQQTYEEWFVRFKFPGNENVEVDEVSGLPEGWEVTEIQELSSVITGKTPTTSKSQYYGNDIPFIKTPDLHSSIYMTNVEQFLSLEGANSQKNKFFEKNTILLSCIGARAGAVGLTSEISQCNQQINGMICKDEVYIFYLYFFCRGLTPLLRALGSNGATMTNVSKGKLEKVNIVKPHLNIITSFHSKVKNDFAVILNLQNQNQHLKEARDILLPRLMSGMIDVDGLEVSEKLGMVAEEQANHTQ